MENKKNIAIAGFFPKEFLIFFIDGKTSGSKIGVEVFKNMEFQNENGKLKVKVVGSNPLLREISINGKIIRENEFQIIPPSILKINEVKISVFESIRWMKREKYIQFHKLIAKSEQMIFLFHKALLFSQERCPIVITGESGVGKELLARAIHLSSHRKNSPFIPVNCSAIPENLFESEFFGVMQGAFTDARASRQGLFENADGGTLFLDEISEIPSQTQAKLLRVLEYGEVRRIGSGKILYPDVRIIAATNRNLITDVQNGFFRADLYHRLNVLQIEIPPLRERKKEIEIIVLEILKELSENKNFSKIPASLLSFIKKRKWSGNIRELRNFLQRLFIISSGEIGENIDFSSFINEYPEEKEIQWSIGDKLIDREIFFELNRRGGKKKETYKRLNIPKSTFYYRLKKMRAG